MGRKGSYVAYRRKVNGQSVGNYRYYDPTIKDTIDLGTEDEFEAKRIVASRKGGGNAPQNASSETIPQSTSVQSAATESPPSVIPAVPEPSHPSGAGSSVSARDIISSWISSNPGTNANDASDIPGPGRVEPQDSTTPQEPKPVIPTVAPKPVKTAKGLTPEQAAKLGRGLTKVVSRLNVVGVDACVRLMGRDPFPPDEEEMELLQMGWELLLEQYFIKEAPEPWHLILAANLTLAVTMYARGKPLPKRESKDIEPTMS